MAFLFCITNLDTKDLLKEEMKVRYPGWRFAYSEGELITYKADSVKIWPKPFFARISGECLNTGEVLKGEMPLVLESGKTWRGILHHPQHIFKTPMGISPIELPSNAPSRAWLKMAEAHALLKMPFKKGETVLELGSAPGGISLYLLNQGLNVLGVDKAKMDDICLKFKTFKHLNNTVFEIHPQNVKFDWLVSDVNLDPSLVVGEAHRLIGNGEHVKGVLLTLKITKPSYISKLVTYLQSFHQKDFQCELQLLPSHREEILLRAWHS